MCVIYSSERQITLKTKKYTLLHSVLVNRLVNFVTIDTQALLYSLGEHKGSSEMNCLFRCSVLEKHVFCIFAGKRFML